MVDFHGQGRVAIAMSFFIGRFLGVVLQPGKKLEFSSLLADDL